MRERVRSGGRAVDAAFVLGVVVKAVSGVLELAAGLPLLVLGPAPLVAAADRVVAWLLAVDPDNAAAPLLAHSVDTLGSGTSVLVAVYLLFHGVVKLGIVLALLRGSRSGHLASIVALGVFLVVQVAELVVAPGAGVAALTVVDALLLSLTWREWRRGHTLRGAWRNVVPRRHGSADRVDPADTAAAPEPVLGRS